MSVICADVLATTRWAVADASVTSAAADDTDRAVSAIWSAVAASSCMLALVWAIAADCWVWPMAALAAALCSPWTLDANSSPAVWTRPTSWRIDTKALLSDVHTSTTL